MFEEESKEMAYLKHRKKVLALALSAMALPVSAQTLVLDNDNRINSSWTTYGEPVRVTGSYSSNAGENTPVRFTDDVFEQGLTLDATITLRGNDVSGASLEFMQIQGDLIHAATGRIEIEDVVADQYDDGVWGLSVTSGEILGKLINHGYIEVRADDAEAAAIELGSEWEELSLGGIENHGSVVAHGHDAVGLAVENAHFAASPAHIVNTGLIRTDDAAIRINAFTIGDEGSSGTLVIRNSGDILSADEAIDVNPLAGNVKLLWDAGTISGDLFGLSEIVVSGQVHFNGELQLANSDPDDGVADIRMREGGWVRVGGASAGHLEFGAAHSAIEGNLGVAAGSSLDLNLSAATSTSAAIVAVSGTAEFASGSQIRLAAQATDFLAEGSSYTLLEAGTLQNGGVSVISRSLLLDVDSYAVQGNSIVAVVSPKVGGEVGGVIAEIGGSQNAQRAGAAFSDVAGQLAQLAPDDPLFLAYVAASQDPAALKRLVEQLPPDVNGGASHAATSGQGIIGNATGNRMGGLRGAASGDALKDVGAWAQVLYSDADQGVRSGVAGFNAYSSGIAVGADGRLGEAFTLGAAYSYLHSDVRSDGGNTTDVDGHALTLYGSFEHGAYFVDAGLSYGINRNDSKRHVAGTTAKGDYDSDVLGLNLAGGYTFRPGKGLLVEPRLAVRYVRVDLDSYREKGSAAALHVQRQRYEVAELGAGVRLAGSFEVGSGTLRPQAKLMAYHDFAADEAKSTSTFVLGNTPFVTHGANAVRNSYEVGLGVDYQQQALTFSLGYDYTGKADFDAHTLTARLRYDF